MAAPRLAKQPSPAFPVCAQSIPQSTRWSALEEETLSAARAADEAQARGEVLGPLHGVPVATNHGQHKRANHHIGEKGAALIREDARAA